MKLTDLFIKRPSLVTVLLALILLGGTISANVLVKQQFPNYDVPTIQIALTYPGGSTTEIRDAIVRPIEDQIAGAPDLDAIETAIQPGQATIVARFALSSDQNSDLVQVQGRVQNAQRQLPSDLQTPQITIYDPSQAVVVSLTAKSFNLRRGPVVGAGDQQGRAGDRASPGHFVRRGERRRDAVAAGGGRPARAQFVRLYLDRHRQRDLYQQRARAGRHRLRAQPRNLDRYPRRRADSADGRQSSARNERSGLERHHQRVRNNGPADENRRRGCGSRHLRTAARLRLRPRHAGHRTGRAEGRQHQRGGGIASRVGRAPQTHAAIPRHQLYRAERAGDLHQGTVEQRLAHAGRSDRRYRHRHAVLPAFVAECDRRHDCDSGLAAGDARGDAAAGLHARHRFAAGDDADYWHFSRRLDRRFGKYRTSRGRRRSAVRCRLSRPFRDRNRGLGDHAGRRRRLPADFVLAGCRRAVLARVRIGRCGGDAHVAVHFVYDHAVAGRALVVGVALETVEADRCVHRLVRPHALVVRRSRAHVGIRKRADRRADFVRHVGARLAGAAIRHRWFRIHSQRRSRRALRDPQLSDRNAARNDAQGDSRGRARHRWCSRRFGRNGARRCV